MVMPERDAEIVVAALARAAEDLLESAAGAGGFVARRNRSADLH
jgi:hypothetical protein